MQTPFTQQSTLHCYHGMTRNHMNGYPNIHEAKFSDVLYAQYYDKEHYPSISLMKCVKSSISVGLL